MERQELDPDVVAKARQLAELVSWIFYDDRRLGLLDRCERLEGEVADGNDASLIRHGADWELRIDNSETRTLSGFEAVLRATTSSQFVPRRVVVVPRFAGLLFQAAVEQSQAGLTSYLQYLSAKQKAREEKTGDLDGPEFFAMVLGIPTRALRSGARNVVVRRVSSPLNCRHHLVNLGGGSTNQPMGCTARRMDGGARSRDLGPKDEASCWQSASRTGCWSSLISTASKVCEVPK